MAMPAGAALPQPPCRTAVEAPDFAFAAGCLIRDDGRMLGVRHRFGGRLGFPGGRARSGESAQCVAHRETWEETGVEVVVHEMLRRFGNGFALYRCEPLDQLDATIEVPASGRNEITQVLWIDPRDTRPEDWRFPRDHPEVLKLLRD
ncbi:MAG TPA: NUDIX hydrolase [Arenicellales bacterium]|nr:NUDIX hydrolase [Arenicellales bacterium]